MFFLLFLFLVHCIFFIGRVVYLLIFLSRVLYIVLIFLSKVSFFFSSFSSNPLACLSVFGVYLGIKIKHYNSFLLSNTFLFSVIAASMMHRCLPPERFGNCCSTVCGWRISGTSDLGKIIIITAVILDSIGSNSRF